MKRSDIPDMLILRLVAERWALIRGQSPQVLEYPPTPVQTLSDRWPSKVVRAKMEQLVERGLLECSSGADGAWLTPAGEQVVASG